MIVELDRSSGLLTKRSESAQEADCLRREAVILDCARHPGLTELLDLLDDSGLEVTLRVGAVDAISLAELSTRHGAWMDDGEVAGLGAAVATTLADLHDLGLIHGAVSPDHILIDHDGRPVLCSLGRGRRVTPGRAVDDTDVPALAALLLACLPPAAGSRTDPLRRRLVQATRPGRRGGVGARRLASRLAQVPGATLPSVPGASSAPRPGVMAARVEPAPQHRGDSPVGRDRQGRVLVVAAGGVAAVVAAIVLLRPGAPGRPAPGVAQPQCPPVDLGCQPLANPAGVVDTGRGLFAIGAAGDRVVVGRWRCATPLPALLETANGRVWAFDEWPAPGRRLAGRLVGDVDGAISLKVDPGRRGCDRLVVARRNAPAMEVDPA